MHILSPNEIAKAMVETGHKKATTSTTKLFIMGILAGAFIAFGAIGAIIMAAKVQDPGLAKLLGASVFPVGLMLVIMAGAELFTGNNLMTLGIMTKRVTWSGLLRNWVVVYIGNFIGSIAIAALIVSTGIFSGAVGEKAIAIANTKVNIINNFGLMAVFSRAIFCNIIVVLAVWIAGGAKDMIGKIFACWFPIMLFVLSGYEHSIANMFFIPVGWMLGGEMTWLEIWTNNLIPVTIGNIIGGAIIVPIAYYLIHLND